MKFKIFILTIWIISAGTHCAYSEDQNDSYSIDVPYEKAIPAFLEEAAHEVETKMSDPDPTFQWFKDTGQRLDEFLDDWLEAVKTIPDQSFGHYNTDAIEDTSQKWTDIINSMPGKDELETILTPLTNNLFKNLPRLRPTKNGDVPLANIREYYKEMEELDPWRMGSLFKLESINENVITVLSEHINEQTQNGVRTNTVVFREKKKEVNGETTYYVLIENDRIIDEFKKEEDRTLIHEILRKMTEDNGDPKIIEGLNSLVNLIDFHLDQLTLAKKPKQVDIYKPGYTRTTLNSSHFNWNNILKKKEPTSKIEIYRLNR